MKPPKFSKPWTCPDCGAVNKLTDGACLVCHEPRPKHSQLPYKIRRGVLRDAAGSNIFKLVNDTNTTYPSVKLHAKAGDVMLIQQAVNAHHTLIETVIQYYCAANEGDTTKRKTLEDKATMGARKLLRTLGEI